MMHLEFQRISRAFDSELKYVVQPYMIFELTNQYQLRNEFLTQLLLFLSLEIFYEIAQPRLFVFFIFH